MRILIAGTIALFFTISANAQPSKSEFHKTVAGINAIIKMNKLAYYTDNKQNYAFIKQISATKQGIITFTDSIAKAESNTPTRNKQVLLPDCCPQKTIRTLDLFAIKQWDIQFPYTYLKDKDNQTYGSTIGIRKADIYKLKEQFDKLTTLCRKKKPAKILI